MPRTPRQRLYLEASVDKALHNVLARHARVRQWSVDGITLEDGSVAHELRLYRPDTIYASDAESLPEPEYVLSLDGAVFKGGFSAIHDACVELEDTRGRTVTIEVTRPSVCFQLRVWVDRETAAALA